MLINEKAKRAINKKIFVLPPPPPPLEPLELELDEILLELETETTLELKLELDVLKVELEVDEELLKLFISASIVDRRLFSSVASWESSHIITPDPSRSAKRVFS